MDYELINGLIVMVAIALYIAACYLAGWAAKQRGREGGWMLVAVFVTPVVALLALIAAGTKTRGK